MMIKCHLFCFLAYFRVFYHALTAPQIFLGIHHHSLPSRQTVLEHWIARREGNAVVAAFDDVVNLREHRLHLGQSGGVVPEIVRSRQ